MANHYDRRTVLGGLAAALTAGTAGCTDALGGPSENDGPSVAASFFVLGDLASAVVGDAGAVDTLVPVGQHGHGWQPSADVPQRAIDADAFVYMAGGFQPWADDVVENVREGDGDAELVEARTDVELLEVGGDDDHDDGHGEDDHHDRDGDEHEGDHDDDHEEHEEGPHDEDEHEGEHDGEDGAGNGDHDHGDVDPHFWLDPTRTATAVDTIADGLASVDGLSAEDLAANAETFQSELAALDGEFEEALADRTRDTVLVAGHDAFQYLADRYDFAVVALTGISPDDTATTDDVTRAQAVIEEHDVRHVLAPVMESDRAARSLVEDTDAEEVLPITAIPGRHEDWKEAGWGYLDIMREVNLPSLETALGAQ